MSEYVSFRFLALLVLGWPVWAALYFLDPPESTEMRLERALQERQGRGA